MRTKQINVDSILWSFSVTQFRILDSKIYADSDDKGLGCVNISLRYFSFYFLHYLFNEVTRAIYLETKAWKTFLVSVCV